MIKINQRVMETGKIQTEPPKNKKENHRKRRSFQNKAKMENNLLNTLQMKSGHHQLRRRHHLLAHR